LTNYIFKKYEPGFEIEQAQIAKENALEWLWPYTHTAESFKKIYTNSNFDDDTVLYCFDNDSMVGYIHAEIGKGEGVIGPDFDEENGIGASFDFPRVKKGFEDVAALLLEELIVIMKRKGIDFLQTRVTTMRENNQQIIENFGFKPHPDFPMGYKYYYVYDLAKGRIEQETPNVRNFTASTDLKECSKQISSFLNMLPSEAEKFVLEMEKNIDLVSHLVISKEDTIEAYCYALPNYLKEEMIATFYIDATSEEYLTELLVKTIERSIEKKGKKLLIDVIGVLLKYEETFVKLGFTKEATWGIYTKRLE